MLPCRGLGLLGFRVLGMRVSLNLLSDSLEASIRGPVATFSSFKGKLAGASCGG